MSNKKKISIIIIALLFVFITLLCIYLNPSSEITDDVSKMISNAEHLYEEGKKEDAVYQMKLYCQERPGDEEAWIKLGDLYMENGEKEAAYGCYKNASACIPCEENELSEAEKVKSFEGFEKIESIKISPAVGYTENMTLYLTGGDLTPKDSFSGIVYIDEVSLTEDPDYKTTDWFSVDPQKENVFITGDINYAKWQFMDKDGSLRSYEDTFSLRTASSYGFYTKSFSSIEIPEDAVRARVTYYDKKLEEDSVSSDGAIFIGYGSDIKGYTGSLSYTIPLPDLKNGEYIEYKQEKWTLYNEEASYELDFPEIEMEEFITASISGNLLGKVEFTLKEKEEKRTKESIYGIRYDTKSSAACCERTDDAAGMQFDYMLEDGSWYYGTGNDFDEAYPWSEMELCNIKTDENGEETITLYGEDGFSLDGSNGNVMVRIPLFYSKREVVSDEEYICISGTEHDGFEPEPVFIDEDGTLLEYVYIGAYLGTQDGEKIVSTSETYPTILLEYGTTLEYAENNGAGFKEMDFLLLSAMQKLFIIETGSIDSSEVFAGESNLYYQYDTSEYETSGYAVEDAYSSNTVTLYDSYNTNKICEGSSIILLEKDWTGYSNKTAVKREVTAVIDTGDFIEVTFDGAPVDIKKHQTLVSNIPSKTGKTDQIGYSTGVLEGEEGKKSFKYRNIENLYGSACVMLDDDAYVKDSFFYYKTGDGIEHKMGYAAAEQEYNFTSYKNVNVNMCVKKMGYDEENPLIMIPSEVGNGASVYSHYGDAWMYTDSRDGTPNYFVYGGALDNERAGGLFQERAVIKSMEMALDFYSARIMYK